MSKSKGTRGEKKVVSWFEDHGWYAQRTGGSGAGTDRDRPDVVAMRPNGMGVTDCVVAEVKNKKGGTSRFKKEDVQQLKNVARKSGGLGLFVTKPDLRKSQHPHMYAFTADELKENAKSYSITKKMIQDGPSIQEQIESHF